MLLWPPPTVSGFDQDQRVDLLGLVPPNRFDDLCGVDAHCLAGGVVLRADRVILPRERYPDAERATQHKLSDDLQAACREQGHVLSVKEWADKNQHRGTLRLRLRCRSSSCRFQFQLNWDSKAGFWYISRRRCGTFVHTCAPHKQHCQVVNSNKDKALTTAPGNKRRTPETPKNNDGPSNKRARVEATTSFQKNDNTDSKKKKPEVLDALDSARSLLDLSRAPSSPRSTASEQNNNNNEEENKSSSQQEITAKQEFVPMRSFYLPHAASFTAPLSAQEKLALYRNQALKVALQQQQQRCFPLLQDPSAAAAAFADPRLHLSGAGLLNFQGGAFGSI